MISRAGGRSLPKNANCGYSARAKRQGHLGSGGGGRVGRQAPLGKGAEKRGGEGAELSFKGTGPEWAWKKKLKGGLSEHKKEKKVPP